MHLQMQAPLTAEDYGNAQILHVGKRYPLILFLFLGVVAPVLIIGGIYVIDPGPEIYIIAPLVLVFSLLLAGMTAFCRLPRRLKARAARLYQQHTALQTPREIELTDDLYLSHSERFDSRLPWADFHKWKHNDVIILVYSSDLLMNMFPRRWFASEADYQGSRMCSAKRSANRTGRGSELRLLRRVLKIDRSRAGRHKEANRAVFRFGAWSQFPSTVNHFF